MENKQQDPVQESAAIQTKRKGKTKQGTIQAKGFGGKPLQPIQAKGFRGKPLQPIQAKGFNGKPLQPIQRKQTSRFGETQMKANVSSITNTNVMDAQVNYNSPKPSQVGAVATAQGNEVNIATSKQNTPPELLGHELAHVAQQQNGEVKPTIQAKNGTQINNDPILEKKADIIGAQAKAMGNANHWGTMASLPKTFPDTSIVQNKVLQRYTVYSPNDQALGKSRGWKEPGGRALQVADDGKLAVADNQEETKDAWALESKIKEGNDILKRQESQIVMKPGGSKIQGKTAGGQTSSLTKVKLESASGGPAKLRADCGSAALQGIGAHLDKYAGITREDRHFENYTQLYDYEGGRGLNAPSGKISSEIYQRMALQEANRRLSRQEALAWYEGLDKKEKTRLDKKYGINRYAVPRIGQGLMIGTEDDMPGYQSDNALGRRKSDGKPRDTWNFHFATAVMRSGSDYVTAENYYGKTRTPDDWHFKMFGPAEKHQDFHYQNAEVDQGFGSRNSTMVVNESHAFVSNHLQKRLMGLLSSLAAPKQKTLATTNAPGVRLIATMPADWNDADQYVLLPKGTQLEIVKQGREWSIVKVVGSGDYQDRKGWVSNIFLEKTK